MGVKIVRAALRGQLHFFLFAVEIQFLEFQLFALDK